MGGFTFQPVQVHGLDLLEFTGPERADILEAIFQMWEPDTKARKKLNKDRFPGPDPVPVMRRHFVQLKTPPGYLISDKTDGVRMLMAICKVRAANIIVLMDRRMRLYNVAPMELPTEAYRGTLLDGELVTEKATNKVQYLAFDAMAAAGKCLMRDTFVLSRLSEASTAILCAVSPQEHLLEIRWKHFFPLEQMQLFLAHLQRASESYEVDGAILTPTSFTIRSGAGTGILKFKQATDNTVDFTYRSGELYVNSSRGKGDIKVAALHDADSTSLTDESIVECKLDGDAWHLVRVRVDKARSNTHDTYQKTLEVMQENLTFDDLLVTFGQ